MHVIAAKAVSFKEAMGDDFKEYQKQVVVNAKAMATEGQEVLDEEAKLPSLRNNLINQLANRKPIRLGSGLLVFLDRLKKNSFLREWDAALIQN